MQARIGGRIDSAVLFLARSLSNELKRASSGTESATFHRCSRPSTASQRKRSGLPKRPDIFVCNSASEATREVWNDRRGQPKAREPGPMSRSIRIVIRNGRYRRQAQRVLIPHGDPLRTGVAHQLIGPREAVLPAAFRADRQPSDARRLRGGSGFPEKEMRHREGNAKRSHGVRADFRPRAES